MNKSARHEECRGKDFTTSFERLAEIVWRGAKSGPDRDRGTVSRVANAAAGHRAKLPIPIVEAGFDRVRRAGCLLAAWDRPPAAIGVANDGGRSRKLGGFEVRAGGVRSAGANLRGTLLLLPAGDDEVDEPGGLVAGNAGERGAMVAGNRGPRAGASHREPSHRRMCGAF